MRQDDLRELREIRDHVVELDRLLGRKASAKVALSYVIAILIVAVVPLLVSWYFLG